MYFVSNFCAVFIMTGLIAFQQVEASSIQLADSAGLSHGGTVTVRSIN